MQLMFELGFNIVIYYYDKDNSLDPSGLGDEPVSVAASSLALNQ